MKTAGCKRDVGEAEALSAIPVCLNALETKTRGARRLRVFQLGQAVG